jgi:hypothetical protein
MQSINEFMQAYFSERMELHMAVVAQNEPFRQKFFTPEFSDTLRRSYDAIRSFALKEPAKIVSVQQTEASAEVTTTEPVLDRHKSFRYHLQRSGQSWLVQRREWECFVCKGTGTRAGGRCTRCDGTGWKNYGGADA